MIAILIAIVKTRTIARKCEVCINYIHVHKGAIYNTCVTLAFQVICYTNDTVDSEVRHLAGKCKHNAI